MAFTYGSAISGAMSGAGTGASVGAAFGGIGAVPGAIAGAVLGAVGGGFAGGGGSNYAGRYSRLAQYQANEEQAARQYNANLSARQIQTENTLIERAANVQNWQMGLQKQQSRMAMQDFANRIYAQKEAMSHLAAAANPDSPLYKRTAQIEIAKRREAATRGLQELLLQSRSNRTGIAATGRSERNDEAIAKAAASAFQVAETEGSEAAVDKLMRTAQGILSVAGLSSTQMPSGAVSGVGGTSSPILASGPGGGTSQEESQYRWARGQAEGASNMYQLRQGMDALSLFAKYFGGGGSTSPSVGTADLSSATGTTRTGSGPYSSYRYGGI